MLKNTKDIRKKIFFAIIPMGAIRCFTLFSHQFSDRSYGSICYSRPILFKFNSKVI